MLDPQKLDNTGTEAITSKIPLSFSQKVKRNNKDWCGSNPKRNLKDL